MPKVRQLERVIWDKRIVSERPDIKPDGVNWLMDTMPFHAVLKEKLTDDKSLQYLCEGKYISFKPVGGLPSNGLLGQDKRSVSYRNALGVGISIELYTSQAHWRKLIKINSLKAADTKGEFVEFRFEVETDFDIPERENIKPRIKLGKESYIEISKAWDSSPPYTEEEIDAAMEGDYDLPDKGIPVTSFFHRIGGKLYFTKQIPTDWLRQATFPVYTDLDIVWGTASEFESGRTVWCQCCEIAENKFVVAYRDDDDGDAGKARVATVSGTTITWGAISEFCRDVGTGGLIGACKLDTDKFVVVYTDDFLQDDGYARVGTVSTRTISWGTAKEFHTTDAESTCCCQLGTDKFAIVFNDETGGDLGSVCICTVSGTTITAGTSVAFEGRITGDRVRCCKLDTDKFVAFYQDYGDLSHAKACAFTVSGTTPTAGTIKDIDTTGSCNYCRCEQLDTDKFVIIWSNDTSNKGIAAVCTVSGTTITKGAESEFNTDRIKHSGVAVIDASHFVVTYIDEGNLFKGTSRYCSFSGTTITLDGEEIFHDALTQSVAICLISANKVAVVYMDDADVSDHGEAIIGDVPVAAPTKTYTLAAKLVKRISKTYTLAAKLVKRISKTYSLAAKLVSRVTKTYTLGARLRITATKTYTLAGKLISRELKTYTLAARFLKTQTQTYSLAARLRKLQEKTYTITGRLIKLQIKTYTLGTRLKKLQAQTYTIGAHLIAYEHWLLMQEVAALERRVTELELALKPKAHFVV